MPGTLKGLTIATVYLSWLLYQK